MSSEDAEPGREWSVVLAGGGTTGHVAPLLATADALQRYANDHGRRVRITVIGTEQGLEARLVPEAGYPLVLVPRVPMPRRFSMAALRWPVEFRRAITTVVDTLHDVHADAVVGFGGYVSTPAYLAGRRVRVPIVLHEGNARPGWANRLGARYARRVAVTFPDTPLSRAEVTGMPLRRAITDLDRAAAAPQARTAFGLEPDRPTLVVTGGSLGSQRLNDTFGACAADLVTAGWQVLHLSGRGKHVTTAGLTDLQGCRGRYQVREYSDSMDQVLAAADAVVCRSGAGTVSEVTALGLPAVYVPLPIGNGEQRWNAAPVVNAGGALLVDDATCTPDWVRRRLLPVLQDPARLTDMGSVAARFGIRDGAQRLVRVVTEVLTGASPVS